MGRWDLRHYMAFEGLNQKLYGALGYTLRGMVGELDGWELGG